MATLPAMPRWSAAEYLHFEHASSNRHEFFDGMVVAMAPSPDRHSFVAANLLGDLSIHLENTNRRSASIGFRVHLPESNAYFYPDLTIICRDPETTISHPKLVIEVLSPTTESIDRDYKRSVYQSSPTILDYLIVHPNLIFVEHDTRSHPSAPWEQFTYSQPEDTIALPSIQATLSLARIYRNLDFTRP
jgi:Uma2 family endonuclease